VLADRLYSGRFGKRMPEQSNLPDDRNELQILYDQALELLKGLDRLGLDHAGAHLSMAIEIMRQRHPCLAAFD
jgi:hypothetical protein